MPEIKNTALPVDVLELEIMERERLINTMVGTLYPSILRDEIKLIREVILWGELCHGCGLTKGCHKSQTMACPETEKGGNHQKDAFFELTGMHQWIEIGTPSRRAHAD